MANKKIGNGDVKEAKTPGCMEPPWFLCSLSHSCLPDQDSELNVTDKYWRISHNFGPPLFGLYPNGLFTIGLFMIGLSSFGLPMMFGLSPFGLF